MEVGDVVTAHRVLVAGIVSAVIIAASAGAVWAVAFSQEADINTLASTAVEQVPDVGVVVSVTEIPASESRYTRFEVTTDRGTVLWLDEQGRMVGSSGNVGHTKSDGPMSIDEARSEAHAFVGELYPDLAQLGKPVEIRVSDDSFIFAWEEKTASGVRLTRSASVRVNLQTGSLSGYSARYDKAEVPALEPEITEAQVRESFSKDPDHKLDTIKEVSLEVRTDRSGVDRLVWTVDYRVGVTYPDGRVVESTGVHQLVDAASGADVTDQF